MRKKVAITILLVAGFFGLLYVVQYVILGGTIHSTPPADTIAESTSKALRSSPDTNPSTAAPVLENKNFKIVSTKYFGSKTWAVVYILPVQRNGGDPAYIVMHKLGNTYQTVVGPGSLFDRDNLQSRNVPQEVITYLDSLNLVGSI